MGWELQQAVFVVNLVNVGRVTDGKGRRRNAAGYTQKGIR
jgi:hypothetical protein